MISYPAPLFLQHSTGPSTVAAEPIRHHLDVLSRHGIGYRRAAELAGLTPAVTRRIVFGRDGILPTRVSRVKAEQLLAVHPDDTISYLVPSLGTQRRIQALMVNGWSQAKLADRLGCALTNFKLILQRKEIRPATAAAVSDLFDELWNVAPPTDTVHDKAAASRSKAKALLNGWVPPLAWDDIDTDPDVPTVTVSPVIVDQAAIVTAIFLFMVGLLDAAAINQKLSDPYVDWIAVDRACDGIETPLNYHDRRAAIRRLNARYLSDRDIATVLHLHDRVVHRIRHTELDLPARFNADQTQVIA